MRGLPPEVLIVLGAAVAILNMTELVLLDGGWPQIVGLVLGVGVAGFGLARRRAAADEASDA